MNLPYRKRAFVPPDKMKGYLLSLTHPKGKYKSVIFRRIGFNESNINLFEEALLSMAYNNEVTSEKDIVKNEIYYGKSYVIIGPLNGPTGNRNIKTVWKILENKRKPSLVTVSPM